MKDYKKQSLANLKNQIFNRCLTGRLLLPVLVGVPCIPLTVAAQPGVTGLEEIIVTARRRDERLQDVPVTVNVVTADMIESMNIRRFEDLQDLVAGLELQDRDVAPIASIRGVRYDPFANASSTVQFYLNDAPVGPIEAMHSMFDVEMIEVLRGPQGTQRGAASPSGSIIMTTRRPDLNRFTADIDITATNKGGQNIRGGFSLPLVEDVLAVRFAGFVEENRINHVRSFRTGDRDKMEHDGWRASLRFTPTENLSINAYYQEFDNERSYAGMVESAHLESPDLAAGSLLVRARDRRSSQLKPSLSWQDGERTGVELEWNMGPVLLNYSGSLDKGGSTRKVSGDTAGFFDESYPEALHELGQFVDGTRDQEYHEVRLSGAFNQKTDYVIGATYSDFEGMNDILNFTPVFLGAPAPENLLAVVETPVVSHNLRREWSAFGHVTYQLSDKTELAGGLRYINFKLDQGTSIIGGSMLSDHRDDWDHVIYTVSLAHNFTPDLMAYVAAGSSWRPGSEKVGNTNTARTQREQGFLSVGPEKSDSIELGLKSMWLDNRLQANITAFYQKFDGYSHHNGAEVSFVNTDIQGFESVGGFEFLAPVDVDAFGVELDTAFEVTDRWSIGGTYSWAQGTLKGDIACNDYMPRDGSPDKISGPPLAVEQIRDATGGDNLSMCSVSMRSYDTPTWAASLRTEYSFPLLDRWNGYARLQARLFGNSKGSPENPNDQVSSYGIFDLYAGVRSFERETGRWEVMAFVKNIMNTQRKTDFGINPIETSMQVVPFGNVIIPSEFRDVSLTAPREVGLNLRYSF